MRRTYWPQAIAAKFGGRSLLLPAPAVVDTKVAEPIEALPLVKRVKQLYQEATVAIVSVACPDPGRSTVVRVGLLGATDVNDLISRGAVGEIASHWWFDGGGRTVGRGQTHAIGLGLEGLAQMVKRRAKVVAVVGASKERIRPLRVTLQCGLANVLVTDHVSARLLLADD